MMTLHDVKTTLEEAFTPTQLDIVDNTWMHAGHAGSNGGAHLKITIASPKFNGVSIIDQHRMVQTALQQAMASQLIHALELKTLTTEG
jgi:BolA family transcriptional regulator, general stress-responsive regulator